MKLQRIGIALVIVVFTCLPAVANDDWEQLVNLSRYHTYAEGRRNVQIFGDVGEDASNVWMTASVMTYPGRHAGVVFRCDKDIKNYYEVLINEHMDELALIEYRSGKGRNLNKIKLPGIVSNRYYELWVRADGQWIGVWLDGMLKISFNDETPLGSGFTGTTTYHRGAMFIDFQSWKKIK